MILTLDRLALPLAQSLLELGAIVEARGAPWGGWQTATVDLNRTLRVTSRRNRDLDCKARNPRE